MKKQNEKIEQKSKAKKCRRKEEGITLIALVVTIIVLLILAGVSIVTLTGQNSILKQAEAARTETKNAGEKEQIAIAYDSAITENYANKEYTGVTPSQLQTQLDMQSAKAKAKAKDDSTIEVTYEESGNTYEVNTKTGKVSKVEVSQGGEDPVVPENPEGIKWVYEAIDDESIKITGIDLSSYECSYNISNISPGRENYSFARINLGIDTLTIPGEIDGKVVKSVEWGAEELGSSYGYDNVIKLKDGTCEFSSITGVENLIFADSIEKIYSNIAQDGDYDEGYQVTFPDVTNLTLPKNLKSIQFAFAGFQSLKEVELPEGLEWMGSAFYKCTSLQSINIPSSVTTIAHNTFYECTNLKSLNIPKNVEQIDGLCIDRNEHCDYFFFSSEVFSKETVINFPDGKNESLEIPDRLWGAKEVTIQGEKYTPAS